MSIMGPYLFGVATGLGLWASWHHWPETMMHLYEIALLLFIAGIFLIPIVRVIIAAIEVLPAAWRNITGKDKL